MFVVGDQPYASDCPLLPQTLPQTPKKEPLFRRELGDVRAAPHPGLKRQDRHTGLDAATADLCYHGVGVLPVFRGHPKDRRHA